MVQTLCQIAVSVTDLRRTHQWYVDVFGLVPAGGTESFKGPLAARVEGVPGARSSRWWLIDRQDRFQLELFQFARPRRVCVRDPEGVLIEIVEEDIRATTPRARPRPEVPSVVRFVSATVPDLDRSRAFFVDGMGLEVAPDGLLHGPEHEALWGLAGARSRSLALWPDDMPLELVEYGDPVGRPWPAGYYVSDQGLLNVAFGYRTRGELVRALGAAKSAGARQNWMILDLLNWGVVYHREGGAPAGLPPSDRPGRGHAPRRGVVPRTKADLNERRTPSCCPK